MADAKSIINKVDYIFQSEAYFLEGTDSATAVATYSASSKERADLISLRASVKTHRDSLSDQELTIYDSVNRLYEAIQDEFVGDTELTKVILLNEETPAQDTITKGLASINSALEKAIGKDALTDITFFGVVTSAASSVSGQIANLITAVGTALTSLSDRIAAVENKLDGAKIGPETPVTVTSCSKKGKKYELGEEIYTTSNDISQAIANGFKCDTFITTNKKKDLYITITGKANDCSSLLSGKDAASACKMYQDADWADA